MSLTTGLILVAIAAFLAALVAQVRWLELERSAFQRKRRRVGVALAGLLLALGCLQYIGSGGLNWLFAPEEDGSWKAVTIDGRPVADRDFVLGLSGGRVSGGMDDCNSWGFSEDAADQGGERMIETTLALCPEEPARRAYWALALGEPVTRLQADGSLSITTFRHQATFRRCKWQETRPSPTSRVTACSFEQ